MGEGGPDTHSTDKGVSDALMERAPSSYTATPGQSLRLSLPSLCVTQVNEQEADLDVSHTTPLLGQPDLPCVHTTQTVNLFEIKTLFPHPSPDLLHKKELSVKPSPKLPHKKELFVQPSPELLHRKELLLQSPELAHKTEMLDPRIRVIPVDSEMCTPSSCDCPPLYKDLDIQCASTSQCTAINDDLRIPRQEFTFLPSFKDFTASESCSLILPTVLDSKSTLSDSSSAIFAICRICHMPGDEEEILISPCRCAGTLQFIHDTCLQRWLEICSKKSRKPPKCELCHFQYHRHKKFKLSHFRFPKVSFQDKVLHCIFLVNLLLMIGCAIATVMCFLSDKGQIRKLPRNNVELTTEEIITLACGVIFFVSFFVAMSVEIKAKHTVYQLFVKFIMRNMEWKIDPYDRSKDSLYAGRYNCNNNNNNRIANAQFV